MIDQQNSRYYLFSLSNFIAAIGGGMILGKGVNTIDVSFLQGSSLLAFFVGTVFGLGFLKLTPEKLSNIFARCFSIFGGLLSLILYFIFCSYAIDEKISGNIAIIFFILLSLRFSFWFYSRVLRASTTAGQQQRIAWVELGYYSGIIMGLVLWVFSGIQLGMAAALLIDSILQISAGFFDFLANRKQVTRQSLKPKNENHSIAIPHKNLWTWRLAFAVMFMTVSVQVIIFNLAHQVSSQFSPYILAFFYLGCAFSAFLCKKLNIRLEWKQSESKIYGYARIHFGINENKNKISFLWGCVLLGVSVLLVVLTVFFWHSEFTGLLSIKEFGLLAIILITTFIYGILELAVLDRIGLEEKNSSQKGMVLHTYGLMSIAAVFSLWLLEITHSGFQELLFMLVICSLFTILTVRKRTHTHSETY